MLPSPAAIGALRAHVIWDASVLGGRETRLAARALKGYRLRNALVQILFFLATAASGLAILWNLHDVHPALLPYICLIALTCGYFAYTQGMGNAPPAVIVSLWRQRAGAVPIDADEASQLDGVLANYPAVLTVVDRWRNVGHALQRRDVDAIACCLAPVVVGASGSPIASVQHICERTIAQGAPAHTPGHA